MGVNNLLKVDALDRCGRESNPRPLDCESNALTNRLLSRPFMVQKDNITADVLSALWYELSEPREQ